MIELGRSYKTRDGREVRIYAVDGGGDYTVHGAIKIDSGWSSATWDKVGMSSCADDHQYDLIEIRPRAIDRMIEWLERATFNATYNPSQQFGLSTSPLTDALTQARQFKSEEDAS